MSRPQPPPPDASGAGEKGPAQPRLDGFPCVLVLGMAGAGKSTLLQRLNAHLHQAGRRPSVWRAPGGASVH